MFFFFFSLMNEKLYNKHKSLPPHRILPNVSERLINFINFLLFLMERHIYLVVFFFNIHDDPLNLKINIILVAYFSIILYYIILNRRLYYGKLLQQELSFILNIYKKIVEYKIFGSHKLMRLLKSNINNIYDYKKLNY